MNADGGWSDDAGVSFVAHPGQTFGGRNFKLWFNYFMSSSYIGGQKVSVAAQERIFCNFEGKGEFLTTDGTDGRNKI